MKWREHIRKQAGVSKGISGNTKNEMMETQGWIVPCEKENSRIDRCQCSGTRIITRAVIRDGTEWGMQAWTSRAVCGVNSARYDI